MPRKHKQPVTTCPPAEADAHLQVETVLSRPTRGRLGTAPGLRVGPAAPRLPRITRLMALAIKFQDLVDRGEVRDYADLARLGHVTRARITQIMNLLNLAPDIQESILFREPVEVSERHVRRMTSEVCWQAQRRRWSDTNFARSNISAHLNAQIFPNQPVTLPPRDAGRRTG